MKKNTIGFLMFTLLIVSILSCSVSTQQIDVSVEKSSLTTETPLPEIETSTSEPQPGVAGIEGSIDVRNLTCEIEGISITLVDGYSEVESAPGSASKIITKFFGNEAYGDLNGDGKEDAAFLITQEGGGSGTFFYIVAALQTESESTGTNAVFLGDRISPQNTEIVDGEIIVNYLDRNTDEPMAVEPTVAVSKYLKIIDGKLEEISD